MQIASIDLSDAMILPYDGTTPNDIFLKGKENASNGSFVDIKVNGR
jgi:hypothetical protein